MFERMRAGWRLAKTVRRSVARDRGIFYYPIISGILNGSPEKEITIGFGPWKD